MPLYALNPFDPLFEPIVKYFKIGRCFIVHFDTTHFWLAFRSKAFWYRNLEKAKNISIDNKISVSNW
jgi:hypothetical protein